MLASVMSFLQRRRRAYQRLFGSGNLDASVVLADLARFCRAHTSTFHQNPDVAKRLDGRREVWLRVQQQVRLTDEQLWALYGTTGITDDEKED